MRSAQSGCNDYCRLERTSERLQDFCSQQLMRNGCNGRQQCLHLFVCLIEGVGIVCLSAHEPGHSVDEAEVHAHLEALVEGIDVAQVATCKASKRFLHLLSSVGGNTPQSGTVGMAWPLPACSRVRAFTSLPLAEPPEQRTSHRTSRT
jgi:hypothetical protein